MELRQLEHFLAVARHSSFTAAARDIPIAQSALSTSVRTLERDLGAVLFERTTRKVELTAAGRAFLPAASRVLADAAAAREEVAAVAGLTRGQVALGTLEMLTSVDLPAELAAFHRAHPGVQVTVWSGMGVGELVDRLLAGEFDLSFLPLTGPAPAGVSVFAEWVEELVLVTAADHRLAGRRRVRVAELDGEKIVQFGAHTTLHTVVRGLAERAGLRWQVAGEVSQRGLLLDLVGSGLGISIVPRRVAELSGLPVIALTQPRPVWSVVLAARSPRPVNPAAAALLTHLLDR